MRVVNGEKRVIVHIGAYNVVVYEDDQNKAVIYDSTTGEGGTFNMTALDDTLVSALDTFFKEEF